jgi:hypothetical protein
MKIVLAVLIAAMTTAAHAQYLGTGSNPNSHSVGGYTTQRGTYVQPHTATNPNGTQLDNYGTRGNINPYNGNVGTRYGRY